MMGCKLKRQIVYSIDRVKVARFYAIKLLHETKVLCVCECFSAIANSNSGCLMMRQGVRESEFVDKWLVFVCVCFCFHLWSSDLSELPGTSCFPLAAKRTSHCWR